MLPRLALGTFPTPVERVDGLLPKSVELWVKREDQSGPLYGGNKVRKLEFLLGDARARGSDRIATIGGFGSHHVLATAIYGRAHGFSVSAVLFPQPMSEHVDKQLRADVAAGAHLSKTRGYLGVPLAVLRAQRGATWIPGGGSSPLGTLGYVEAAREIEAQIAAGELLRPDAIYVALGSGGTAAGLLAGLTFDVDLVAVRVVDRVVANAMKVRRLARASRRLAEIRRHDFSARLRVLHGFFGGAYGRATAAADAAVHRAANIGLRLEPTYTGKAMAALLAHAASGQLDGKRVLFLQTYNGVDLHYE